MRQPSRFLIFAILGPMVGLTTCLVLAFVSSMAQRGGWEANLATTLRAGRNFLNVRMLLLLAPFALASWGASGLSRLAEPAEGRNPILRGLAVIGALLLVSPVSTVFALLALGTGPLGWLWTLAVAATPLAACWSLCRLNERQWANGVSETFA